jgi:hypothetical protein
MPFPHMFYRTLASCLTIWWAHFGEEPGHRAWRSVFSEFTAGLGGAAVTWPCASQAQQPALPVVGFIHRGEAVAKAAYGVYPYRGHNCRTCFLRGRLGALRGR